MVLVLGELFYVVVIAQIGVVRLYVDSLTFTRLNDGSNTTGHFFE